MVHKNMGFDCFNFYLLKNNTLQIKTLYFLSGVLSIEQIVPVKMKTV